MAGKHYTFRLKMRGREVGAEARIGIEFRDQKWRHEMPDTAKTFSFKLDTTWKDYAIEVKSPEGVEPPDPSREAWQIIIRLQTHSGTVDFDDIRLRGG